MKHYRLSENEAAMNGGFTDVFKIGPSDWSAIDTNDLLCNISLVTLNAGDIVRNHTLIEVQTALTPDPSANATVTVSVGRTASSYVDFIAASTVINAGTQLASGTSFAAGEAIADQVIASDSTVVYAQVDITDTDGALATITAGEVYIWLQISRRSERKRIYGGV